MQYWVSKINPNPFISDRPLNYRPIIFFANILLGLFVYSINKKKSIIFFINTIISYVIFSFLWNTWIENHPYSEKHYSFNIENKKYILDISENPNLYEITLINPSPNDTINFNIYGLTEKNRDTTILIHWKGRDKKKIEKIRLYKDTLIGFPEKNNKTIVHLFDQYPKK